MIIASIVAAFVAFIVAMFIYGKHLESHPDKSNVGRRVQSDFEARTRNLVQEVRADALRQFEAERLQPVAEDAYRQGWGQAEQNYRTQLDEVARREHAKATAEFEARMAEVAARQEEEFTRAVEPHLEAAFMRGYQEAQGTVGTVCEHSSTYEDPAGWLFCHDCNAELGQPVAAGAPTEPIATPWPAYSDTDRWA